MHLNVIDSLYLLKLNLLFILFILIKKLVIIYFIIREIITKFNKI